MSCYFISPYYGAVKCSLKIYRFASYEESWMHPKKKCQLWQLSWLPTWVQLWEQTLTGNAFNAPITTPVLISDKKISCRKDFIQEFDVTNVHFTLPTCLKKQLHACGTLPKITSSVLLNYNIHLALYICKPSSDLEKNHWRRGLFS